MKKIANRTPRVSFLAVLCIIGISIAFLYTLWRMVDYKNVLGVTDSATSSATASVVSPTKEFYVPLGTGTNTTTDWADVKGAAAYIDTKLYGKLKKVVFEASISVPSGSQTSYVRLYNATDKHPVWYSEKTMAGSGPELLISSPITLDSGNKLYQVQMKSQLGVLTNLLQARVHIITY